MRVLDAHQHFWQYDPAIHEWIGDNMQSVRKDFLPADLLPVLQKNGVDGCIAVQADESEKETEFLVQCAAENDFIKGVVGWVDLYAADIEQRLQHYQQFPVIKGFRAILQAKDPAYMLHPDFIRGVGALGKMGFTYDVLVFPKHLTAVEELIRRFPQQAFVIDHIAKPDITQAPSDSWEAHIRSIAKNTNVYCKLSGMVTEADWVNWKAEDIFPFLDIVTDAFGTDRLLFGSDWPVCLVAGAYEEVIGVIKKYYAGYPEAAQEAIFSKNAARFYHL